jgi:hypothetical protein
MTLKLKNFEIGGDKLTILAGPCAIESMDVMRKTAEGLKSICEKLDINYVFKSSYDKANRSSINSYRGVGMEKGLEMLAQIKKEFDLPIVTDIFYPIRHLSEQDFFRGMSVEITRIFLGTTVRIDILSDIVGYVLVFVGLVCSFLSGVVDSNLFLLITVDLFTLLNDVDDVEIDVLVLVCNISDF